MKKRPVFLSLLTFVALSTASLPALAEPVDYTIDSGHAYIVFFADHLGFSKFPGTFNGLEGTISFDEESPENSSVSVTFPAGSVDMNHEVLNKKLLGENFFNTEQFSTISFESTDITITGEKTGVINGQLTLLGITKPVALETTFNKKAFNKYAQGMTIGFSAEGSLNRSDFGMDYLLPGVGDHIPFRIEIEGIHKDSEYEERQAE